jgi:hypothetical protein
MTNEEALPDDELTNEEALPDDEPMELVRICAGPAEAKMVEEVLTNNGIECALQGDITGVLPAGDLDDIRVLVPEREAARARELVDAFFTPVSGNELEEGTES